MYQILLWWNFCSTPALVTIAYTHNFKLLLLWLYFHAIYYEKNCITCVVTIYWIDSVFISNFRNLFNDYVVSCVRWDITFHFCSKINLYLWQGSLHSAFYQSFDRTKIDLQLAIIKYKIHSLMPSIALLCLVPFIHFRFDEILNLTDEWSFDHNLPILNSISLTVIPASRKQPALEKNRVQNWMQDYLLLSDSWLILNQFCHTHSYTRLLPRILR